MLHNPKFEATEDALHVKASVFLNRYSAAEFDLSGATVSVKEADGGSNPGMEVELLVAVVIPKAKAAAPKAKAAK